MPDMEDYQRGHRGIWLLWAIFSWELQEHPVWQKLLVEISAVNIFKAISTRVHAELQVLKWQIPGGV